MGRTRRAGPQRFAKYRRALATGGLIAFPMAAAAQGEIAGRVFTDSARRPLAGVEASIPKLGRSAVSDTLGRFKLTNLPTGDHLMLVRAPGFHPESALVAIDGDEVVAWEGVLKRAATILPGQRVVATEPVRGGKMTAFMERKKSGFGHFVSRDQLTKAEGGLMQTGSVLSRIPGVIVKRGSNRAWIASGRAANAAGGCAFCPGGNALNPADLAAGARPACFMDVYLDGAMVFDSKHPDYGLFDVNTIPPELIEGIEVYTSAAQVPAQYNRTSTGCGVLLIWTR